MGAGRFSLFVCANCSLQIRVGADGIADDLECPVGGVNDSEHGNGGDYGYRDGQRHSSTEQARGGASVGALGVGEDLREA